MAIPRPAPALAVALASVALLGGCGGGSKPSTATGTTNTPSSTKAEIRKNWLAFFDGSTPTARRISLLQNGPAFASVLKAVADSPLAKQLKATVQHVRLDGPAKATVTYTLLLANQPVLPNARGTAVLVDGTWKVGTGSFCALLKLQGATPKACSGG
jgi:hypothetical protein